MAKLKLEKNIRNGKLFAEFYGVTVKLYSR